MEELENLKNSHSRMLYIISQMYKDNEISRQVKINLKYLVFLNDANLLGILNKGYVNIQDLKEEIKTLGKNLNNEDLEEEFKSAEVFRIDQQPQSTTQATQEETVQFLAGESSPISSFLQKAKKRKQRSDKPVDNFHLDQAAQNASTNVSQNESNPIIQECDFGASPKVTLPSRRNK
ncbi:unnamed protein product [Moneuplotes crassus]|uniref:Uncharacterized protein n=1 Tax=Euplotes crassus TaxID=5936 RepID=A0AAD1XTB6_EUPCR|nr:unnamed protein product [Moneuplotes crassus]